jgi:DNA (cytosine-5)-methyltransferase 1
MDLGFQQAGMINLGAYDHDAGALAIHRQNLSGPTYECDLSGHLLPNETGNTPDVVLSGSPCQGFSTIGKRVLEDQRNSLLLSAGHIAVKLRPRIFVAENVPAVSFGSHAKYWNQLNSTLTAAGYSCRTLCLTAQEFGVAQTRRRLFLVASLGREVPIMNPSKKTASVARALAGLGEHSFNHQPEVLDENSDDYRIASHIKAGQKLCDVRISPRSVHTWHIPKVFGRTTKLERAILVLIARLRRRERIRSFGDADPVTISRVKCELGFDPSIQIDSLVRKGFLRLRPEGIDLRHTFNGKFRRLDPNGLSPTVDTAFGEARNFLHPTENRGLTVREAARIQGFPDSFQFFGTRAQQYRFVGNAVCPPVAYALATHLTKFILGQ